MVDIALIKKGVLRGELTFFVKTDKETQEQEIFCTDNYTQETLSMKPEVGSQAYHFEQLKNGLKQ